MFERFGARKISTREMHMWWICAFCLSLGPVTDDMWWRQTNQTHTELEINALSVQKKHVFIRLLCESWEMFRFGNFSLIHIDAMHQTYLDRHKSFIIMIHLVENYWGLIDQLNAICMWLSNWSTWLCLMFDSMKIYPTIKIKKLGFLVFLLTKLI